MRRARPLLLVLVPVLLGVARFAAAQLVPLGGQLQVNSYTTNDVFDPVVGMDGAGNFIVVWQSAGSVGSDPGDSIQAQRYDAAGAPAGGQLHVNSYTTSDQLEPAVAVDGMGNFVVVWTSYGSAGSDADDSSVHARRYDAAGVPGSQIQVNSYTTNSQFGPAVAVDGAGNFVVVWRSYGSVGSDADDSSVQGQRFDATGAPVGGQFQVNSYTTDPQIEPGVAVDGAGNFVVVWMSYGSAGPDADGSIQAQRYDASGAPVGGQFQVNTYSTGTQREPAVAMEGAGSFVVAWRSNGSAGSDSDDLSVQAQRYDAAGVQVGGEFQVNSYTTSYQYAPAVAVDGAGNFVVAWQSYGSVGADPDDSVQAQRYDSVGAPVGSQFQVNSYTASGQFSPSVAMDGAGNVVVAWGSNGSAASDQSGKSIQAQRLAVGRTILGRKILVKDPTGNEIQRGVIALGKESGTDIGPTILGDPTVNGATLRVIAKGTTDSDETYVLDAVGWTTAGTTGFRYAGPTGGDGDPVKKVILKRTPGGTALVKVLLKGNTGTQSMDVVPPNAGDEGGLILTVNGGGTYCVAFGGIAGGSETQDSAQLWKLSNAGAEACPTP